MGGMKNRDLVNRTFHVTMRAAQQRIAQLEEIAAAVRRMCPIEGLFDGEVVSFPATEWRALAEILKDPAVPHICGTCGLWTTVRRRDLMERVDIGWCEPLCSCIDQEGDGGLLNLNGVVTPRGFPACGHWVKRH
jgi:hypothetical protein